MRISGSAYQPGRTGLAAHAVLVAGRRSDGLDVTQQTLVDQQPKCVVHRLARDGPDLAPGHLGHTVGGDVWLGSNRPKHSEALRRDMQSMLPEKIRSIYDHDDTLSTSG